MLNILFKNVYLQCDAPRPWGLYFQDSAAPVMIYGKLSKRVKFTNSENILKLLVLTHNWKNDGRWINNSCVVITQLIIEKLMEDCGAKLVYITIKVQRVYGNYVPFNTLWYSLASFEKNHLVKIPFNHINNKVRWFSSITSSQSEKQNLIIHPWFFSGFSDAEGCFTLVIIRNNELNVGWVVKPKFQINLHEKDKALLEHIKNNLRVGIVSKGGSGSQSIQFSVNSIKDLKVIINHFDKYPLISQKLSDYELFKQALNLISSKEHLTLEGFRKIVAIKASMNTGLSDQLKTAFPGVKPVKKHDYKVDNILIPDHQW